MAIQPVLGKYVWDKHFTARIRAFQNTLPPCCSVSQWLKYSRQWGRRRSERGYSISPGSRGSIIVSPQSTGWWTRTQGKQTCMRQVLFSFIDWSWESMRLHSLLTASRQQTRIQVLVCLYSQIHNPILPKGLTWFTLFCGLRKFSKVFI